MKAKERHRLKLLNYMGDPERTFPKRKDLPEIIGFSKKTLYKNFTPLELSEIEKEAVDIRKASSSRQRANVLDSLYQKAIGYSHPETTIKVVDKMLVETRVLKVYPPDRAAAQEFLDRTEGKVIDKKEIGGPGGTAIVPILNVKLS